MKKVWIKHFICALIVYGCNGSGKDNNSAEIIQKIEELKEENQRLKEDIAKIEQGNEPTQNRQFNQPSIPVREKDTDLYNLATRYESGDGVQQDYSEAAKWYRKSVEQGNTGSMNNLGLLYQSGWGVQQDLFEAVKLFRMAADKGNATAQYHLGLCYLDGYGVQKDTSKAVIWLRKAAKQDNLFNNAKKVLETLGY